MFSEAQIDAWRQSMVAKARRATNLTVQQLRSLNDKMNLIPGVRLSETDLLNYVNKFFDLDEDDAYSIKNEDGFSDSQKQERLKLLERLKHVDDASLDETKMEKEYTDSELSALANILVNNLENNNVKNYGSSHFRYLHINGKGKTVCIC